MKTKRTIYIILFSTLILFFILTVQSCSVNKNNKIPKNAISTPKVIDKQLWFVNASYNNSSYRPIPSDPDFYYYSGYPV
ncbi:hypothetical protein, partial [Petrimonas sp.]|uniref:hypothetical protein n=1 Tax=Petrimonas sp. TaxID=2023866 RepID=UPI002FC8A37C